MERTVVIIKPDGLQRGLAGEITGRLERKGLKLVGMKMVCLKDALLNEHYSHHKDKPFFNDLKKFMMSSPVIVQCWEGFGAVAAVRLLAGSTKAREADAGTIRGDLAMSGSNNVVHCSDSAENAESEIKRFFRKDELFEYNKTEYDYVYATEEMK